MAPIANETELGNVYAKFWSDKQRVLWYVIVFPGVANGAFSGPQTILKQLEEWLVIVSCDQLGETLRTAPTLLPYWTCMKTTGVKWRASAICANLVPRGRVGENPGNEVAFVLDKKAMADDISS